MRVSDPPTPGEWGPKKGRGRSSCVCVSERFSGFSSPVFKPRWNCHFPRTPAGPNWQCFLFYLFPFICSWFISHISRQHPADHFLFFLFLIDFLHSSFFFSFNSGSSKVSFPTTVISLCIVHTSWPRNSSLFILCRHESQWKVTVGDSSSGL